MYNKLHYKDTVKYYKKTYETDINWNKKSSYLYNRDVKWYFNKWIWFSEEWEQKISKTFMFTCNLNEDFDRWNYIEYNNIRYSIQDIIKWSWITTWNTKLYLITWD